MTSRVCFNPLDCAGSAESVWGTPTSSIDWCERNYAHSTWVAEPWNTASNLAFVVPGLVGMAWSWKLEKRFTAIFLIIVLIGIGSMAFHATLLYAAQLGDELPMIWGALGWTYVVYDDGGRTLALLLIIAACLEAAWHVRARPTTAFQVLFAALAVSVLPRTRRNFRNCTDDVARTLCRRYVACGIVGLVAWLLDNSFCFERVHLHAVWHLFMGANVYYGITFGAYARTQHLGCSPRIEWWAGCLPVVSLENPVNASPKKAS
ncbi:hypothetical protein CTAYLR_010713 [Chrysophaeum taylorii]|uniref:Alkaline ceramidase n=1 Tax=Chrysophaeum taylorii TaxID=2483200 RepID=A0AAD7UGR5_9STRA|nr:hypothetical protein CTAYLR_010713 [Chrysophaeum taylorii]